MDGIFEDDNSCIRKKFSKCYRIETKMTINLGNAVAQDTIKHIMRY